MDNRNDYEHSPETEVHQQPPSSGGQNYAPPPQGYYPPTGKPYPVGYQQSGAAQTPYPPYYENSQANQQYYPQPVYYPYPQQNVQPYYNAQPPQPYPGDPLYGQPALYPAQPVQPYAPPVYYGGYVQAEMPQPPQIYPPAQTAATSAFGQAPAYGGMPSPEFGFSPEDKKKENAKKRRSEPKKVINAMAAVCLIQVGVSLLLQIIMMIVYSVSGAGLMSFGSNDVINWLSAVLVPLGTFLPALIYVVIKKPDLNNMLRFENRGALQAVLLIFVGTAICWLGNIPAILISNIFESIGFNVSSEVSTDVTSSTWVYIFAVSILAPFMEEFFFRGLIFTKLEKYGTGFAILISGLLFGIAHTQIVTIIFATIAGIALGYIYAKTRNLMVTVIIHVIYNFSTCLSQYNKYFFGSNGKMIINIIYLSFIILGVVSAVILLVNKKWRMTKFDDSPCPKRELHQKYYGRYMIAESTGSLGFKESMGALAHSAVFWGQIAFVVFYFLLMQFSI